MSWKAQQVLWPTPSFYTPIFQLHCASPGCFRPSPLYRGRAGIAAPPGGLKCVLTMPGWSRQCQTQAMLTRVPRLLPSEISRSQPAAMQGRCPKLCRWHREFGTRISSRPPLADTWVWGLCNMAELDYHCLHSFQLLLSRDSISCNPWNT